ncbi:nicotinate-nucleotide adenylyltransferase [Mycoplasma sp. Mirounga ES2805-ORL]|uniref:nicotinate-nucleotide adenylyltransferase n=1 Tax=Mycoplasma sp. Mirounga ES2805-ORL TaxID=754514 RepID=UPI00197BA23E|nr:nicotinate-nucleotide adenylyltransferase [Mycoplasma sp. Mirounga ES2805-ORL]QSF13710.1 nicotinate-nucleotide adenylyltransferase [Mycoplasma sp. Mirounga ES2805-ORL]
MRIGLLGGTFDPIHKGHLEIVKKAYQDLKLDKVLIIPAATNPFKKKQKTASANDRVKMINLAIKSLDIDVDICDFEIKRGGISYTYETIRYLKHKYPNDELFFIMGSDLLPKLHKWEFVEEISHLTQLVVFKRDNKLYKTNFKKFNCLLLNLDKPLLESSTAIRQGNLFQTTLEVNEYIGQNFLYAKEIVHSTLSHDRARHSVYAAEFAAELAKSVGYDAKVAYYAGLFHDIAKEWDYKKSIHFIKRYEPSLLINGDLPRHKHHQICGSLWLKYVYRINNDDIAKAIKVHTTLDFQLSLLDKIVYIADKICLGRKFKGVQKLRKLVYENFNEGFKQVNQVNYDFNIGKGVIFDDEQERIYQKWMN